MEATRWAEADLLNTTIYGNLKQKRGPLGGKNEKEL
jgi:hypothetical protein